MENKNNGGSVNLMRLLSDIAVIAFVFLCTELLISFFSGKQPDRMELWMPIAFIPVYIFIMYFKDMYSRSMFLYADRILRYLSASIVLSGAVVALLFPFVAGTPGMELEFILFLLMTSLGLLIAWLVVYRELAKHSKEDHVYSIIIGTRELIQSYIYFLGKSNYNSKITGYILTDEEPILHHSIRNLGSLYDLPAILSEHVVDEVVFTVSNNCNLELEKYIVMCEERGLTVRIALDLFPMHISKSVLHHVGTIPVLTYHSVSLNDLQLFIKRFLDIVGALFGLAIASVLALFIIPAIKIDSPGPALFKQKRVGLNGRIFHLYKFRSMVIDAEALKQKLEAQNEVRGGLMFKMTRDPRITRIGAFLRKTSLDELPQFLNVLKGEMSLVGTRPPTVDEVSHYQNPHHRRLSIKPGITGNWQVSGRSRIKDFDEVVKLDTLYIDNWSIWRDIWIIMKTAYVLISRDGAV